jgi:hypothetical protein
MSLSMTDEPGSDIQRGTDIQMAPYGQKGAQQHSFTPRMGQRDTHMQDIELIEGDEEEDMQALG